MAVNLGSTIEEVVKAVLSCSSKLDKLIPIFIGTTDQYNQAHGNGEIAEGTIVMITDDGGTTTTAVLGQAILGYMILG